MICKYCGTQLPDDAMFCANCGKAVGNRNKQKKSDSKTTLMVILIVIIVALIGGIVAFLIVRSSFPAGNSVNSMYTGATVSPEKTSEPTATPAITPAPTVPPETQTAPPVPVSEQPAVTGVNTNPAITEYMFESDKTLLTQNDLLKLTQAETRLLLNELYARHGYIFSTQEYKDYFMRKTWYTPKYTSQSDAEALFNGIERQNKVIITNYEQSMGWR